MNKLKEKRMDNPADEVVCLGTIAGGAADELFEEELGKVLANIADPNTEPESVRKIVLTFAIKPSKDRGMGALRVSADSKLAPVRPADATLFFGKTSGRRVAVEHDPAQAGLFDENTPTVVSLTRDKEQS